MLIAIADNIINLVRASTMLNRIVLKEKLKKFNEAIYTNRSKTTLNQQRLKFKTKSSILITAVQNKIEEGRKI